MIRRMPREGLVESTPNKDFVLTRLGRQSAESMVRRHRLGNPITCPFGAPIPGSGYAPAGNSIPLDQATVGQRLVIDRVPEDDQALWSIW